MEKANCILCSGEIAVTDEARKRYDAFVCSGCHDKTRAQIVREMGEEHANFFSSEAVTINGRRCGISNVRVVA